MRTLTAGPMPLDWLKRYIEGYLNGIVGGGIDVACYHVLVAIGPAPTISSKNIPPMKLE